MSSLECGIVGLPNVGKSTLFNALTKNQAGAANYPFCTIDPNVGIVELPDDRLVRLAALSHSQQIVPATVEFIDIAGLVKGASRGEGLGNQFLSHIRQVAAIAHVVRCFPDKNVTHVEGCIDPLRDLETIHLELALADLQSVENILQRLKKQSRLDAKKAEEIACLEKIQSALEEGTPVRTVSFTGQELDIVQTYPFLTNKPLLYVANIDESDLPDGDNAMVRDLLKHAESENSLVIPLCAKLEEELSQLPREEQREMLDSLGLTDSGLDKLVKGAFTLLDLITFITTGEMETRAWTIKRGTKAQQAAGKIHSDIEKGFVRAEVIAYDHYIENSGRAGAKEEGKMRCEGKEYIVQDGDVVHFLHHGGV